MAGAIVDSQLIAGRPGAGIRLEVATPEHDRAIRQLLRSNPMPGAIDLSFEREPDFFRSTDIAGEKEDVVLAFSGRRLVCMGRCIVRPCWLGGAVRRVGYLSELRLDASARGRFDILRRGYAFFEELQRGSPADFYFTSLAADNLRARRLLERGARGLPEYMGLSDYVTLAIPVPGKGGLPLAPGLRPEPATPAHVRGLVEFLNASGARHDLTMAWTEGELLGLERHGLSLGDFRLVIDRGRIAACAALWDQRAFRQVVIRGYSGALRLARPLLNLGERLHGRGRIPAVGSVLACAFLSPIAVAAGSENLLPSLVESFFPAAAERGLGFLALGFDAADPRAAIVRRHFRGRAYRSRLYQVAWRGASTGQRPLAAQLVGPDLALL
jgi:hypothetical protein